MRLNLYIAAALCWLTAEAAPRFTDPVWRPDLGISLPELAGAAAQPTIASAMVPASSNAITFFIMLSSSFLRRADILCS